VKKLLLTVAALAALLSLSACAGSGARLTHQEYEREMQAIARDMQARVGGMERLASAPSYDTFTQLLRELGDLVGEGADRLDSINPPEEIEGAHETLADRLDEVADILDEAADEAEDGDFFAAMAVLERAPDFLDADVRDAIRDIRTAGFYIGDESDWG
jgi:hypothetical protein